MTRKGCNALGIFAILLSVMATAWPQPAFAATISVSGAIYDVNGATIAGATVQEVGNPAVTATSASDGTFTLAGLPSGVVFELQVTKTGYSKMYSFDIAGTTNMTGFFYTLLPADWKTSIGNSPGLGAAAGVVIDLNNSFNDISGAVVTATNGSEQPLTVFYPTSPNGTLTSTPFDGKFGVKNVNDGDKVTLMATENGISFNVFPFTFTGHADGISEGPILGTPNPTDTLWFTGWAANFPAFAPLAGAKVQLVSDPTNATTTNTDGSFTLAGIPQGAPVDLELTQTGYAPSYLPLPALDVNVYAAYGGLPLFTPAELAAWGNTSGNGMILGRVAFQTNQLFDVSGASVTAVGSPSGTTYPVSYWGLDATGSTGSFLVFNVVPGDTVTMNASRAGFTFSPVAVPCPGAGVTFPMITGTATAYASGFVKDATTGAGISGAVVSLKDGSNNSAGAVRSRPDGFFYLGVGASGTYSITASHSLHKPSSPQNVTLTGQTVNVGTLSMNPGASLALPSGWNLISLPVQPANTAIASVLSSIGGAYEAVWAYPDQAWKVYDPNDAQGSTLTTMQAGQGYWIKMAAPGTLTLSAGAAPSPSISLLPGWNLVGNNSTACGSTIPALSSLAGALQVSWGYPSQAWQFYDPVNPSGLTLLCPGGGYWIKVGGAATWTMLDN